MLNISEAMPCAGCPGLRIWASPEKQIEQIRANQQQFLRARGDVATQHPAEAVDLQVPYRGK